MRFLAPAANIFSYVACYRVRCIQIHPKHLKQGLLKTLVNGDMKENENVFYCAAWKISVGTNNGLH